MKAETIRVNVKPHNGKNEWHMAVGPTEYPQPPGKYSKLVVDRGDDGDFTFLIQGNQKFASKAIEFDVAEGFPLPGKPGQFTWEVDQSGKKLTVHDPNSDRRPTDYYYKLNFSDGSSLDPIITNGCCKSRDSGSGGIGSVQLMSATGVIAVLVVSLVLTSLYIAYTRWAK